jgi:hypothetical protein
MIVTLKEAIPMDDYTLQIIMSNSNTLKFSMLPHLNTVQFCPLKDRSVWKNVQIFDTYLLWEGSARVDFSIDTLLSYFQVGRDET